MSAHAKIAESTGLVPLAEAQALAPGASASELPANDAVSADAVINALGKRTIAQGETMASNKKKCVGQTGITNTRSFMVLTTESIKVKPNLYGFYKLMVLCSEMNMPIFVRKSCDEESFKSLFLAVAFFSLEAFAADQGQKFQLSQTGTTYNLLNMPAMMVEAIASFGVIKTNDWPTVYVCPDYVKTELARMIVLINANEAVGNVADLTSSSSISTWKRFMSCSDLMKSNLTVTSRITGTSLLRSGVLYDPEDKEGGSVISPIILTRKQELYAGMLRLWFYDIRNDYFVPRLAEGSLNFLPLLNCYRRDFKTVSRSNFITEMC